jgi:hypothetical protein
VPGTLLFNFLSLSLLHPLLVGYDHYYAPDLLGTKPVVEIDIKNKLPTTRSKYFFMRSLLFGSQLFKFLFVLSGPYKVTPYQDI